MSEPRTRRIELGDLPPVNLFGQNDANLRIIQDQFGARVVARGSEILVEGPPAEVEALTEIFDHLMSVAAKGRYVTPSDVRYAVRMVRDENGRRQRRRRLARPLQCVRVESRQRPPEGFCFSQAKSRYQLS